jgi:hypothetical protein
MGNVRAGFQIYLTLLLLAHPAPATPADLPTRVSPATMVRVGTVDPRFQSYNIEMVEVTGGRFWRPYGPNAAQGNPDLYAYRPPIDLANPRLRKLAAALAPAYMRVSGTSANATYFADLEQPPALPPDGFNAVLTRAQWRGVVDFAQAVGAGIVTSFAVSPGTRDAAGVWRPDQAQRLFAFTRSVGGTVAAAEFMNEPNLMANGAPDGYDASAYGRDFKLFHSLVKTDYPETKILGPGTVGEAASASRLLGASGPGVDAFSYHYYGALSERCRGTGTPEAALSEDWLSGTDRALAFYRALRDRFEPGKPIWLTETAEAACGGNRRAATFLDTFRYLDQLGRLAKAGVQVVMHNTLAASDYGLLDENMLTPRPNYWAALLWRQLMGTSVLDPDAPDEPALHVYAHCQRGTPGGVTLLVINTDRDAAHALRLATPSLRFTLDAASLRDATMRLNGHALALNASDDLPPMMGAPTEAGAVTFAPATITFLTMPAAGNKACGQER